MLVANNIDDRSYKMMEKSHHSRKNTFPRTSLGDSMSAPQILACAMA
jgi:hypothetical protein